MQFRHSSGVGSTVVFLLSTLLAFGATQPRASAQCEVAAGTPLAGTQAGLNDAFGVAVDIDGDVAVVGDRWDDTAGTHAGAAYVFRWKAGTWSEEAKLTASDGDSHDAFGDAVAISGEIILIGAPFARHQSRDRGAVYVYRLVSAEWVEDAKLVAGDAGADDRFGSSVALVGITALIGAPWHDVYGEDAGSAYVYRRDDEGWTEGAKLRAHDAAAGDWFGLSVDIGAEVAVVGAREVDAAYVFRQDGDDWEQEAKLTAGGGHFGFDVAIDDDVCVVGAPRNNRAHVYRHAGGVWTHEADLMAFDDHVGDHFGWAVAVNAHSALVSNVAWDEEGIYIQRPVCVYTHADGLWQPAAVLNPADAACAAYGWSAALGSRRAVVGRRADYGYGLPSYGGTYVFAGLDDCNANTTLDVCDILAGTSEDCNGNGIPDECDLRDGTSRDCNANGVPDECDIDGGTSEDCNENGVPDECDLRDGTSRDCNANGVPDECDIAHGTSDDCNGNGIPDECDIAGGFSADDDENGVPDECKPQSDDSQDGAHDGGDDDGAHAPVSDGEDAQPDAGDEPDGGDDDAGSDDSADDSNADATHVGPCPVTAFFLMLIAIAGAFRAYCPQTRSRPKAGPRAP